MFRGAGAVADAAGLQGSVEPGDVRLPEKVRGFSYGISMINRLVSLWISFSILVFARILFTISDRFDKPSSWGTKMTMDTLGAFGASEWWKSMDIHGF